MLNYCSSDDILLVWKCCRENQKIFLIKWRLMNKLGGKYLSFKSFNSWMVINHIICGFFLSNLTSWTTVSFDFATPILSWLKLLPLIFRSILICLNFLSSDVVILLNSPVDVLAVQSLRYWEEHEFITKLSENCRGHKTFRQQSHCRVIPKSRPAQGIWWSFWVRIAIN